jgi:spore photoproduct lyase
MRTIDDIKVIVYRREDARSGLVERFTSLAGIEQVQYRDDRSLAEIIRRLQADGIGSKEVVILKEFKGRVFQPCPGSSGVVCCNYLLSNICFGCLYDCAYCFLNSYLNSYGIVQFLNTDLALDEISGLAGTSRIYRIGTGEFTDSLMMDRVTRISESIISRVAGSGNIMMEFKTKSDNVDHLLHLPAKGNTLISWSLNTGYNIDRAEADTADLESRLRAAEKSCNAGYLVGFHFDPIILYPNCDDHYLGLVEDLFVRVDPDRVPWISLGCLRYASGFKEVIRDRFPGSDILTGEMFRGPDGKYRYLKKKRIHIYRKMLERIRDLSPRTFVYLCMETSDVWRQVFEVEYQTSRDLEKDFERHLGKWFVG